MNLHAFAEAMQMVFAQNHMVLCGRCYYVDSNGENRDYFAGGYHYHKHPHEACTICGRTDDVPTQCCPTPGRIGS